MPENETTNEPEDEQSETEQPDVEGYSDPNAEPIAQMSDPPNPGSGGGIISDPPNPGSGGGNA